VHGAGWSVADTTALFTFAGWEGNLWIF
jgi:hypothetical protein